MRIGRKSVYHFEKRTTVSADILRLQFASFAEYAESPFGFITDRMQPFVGSYSDVSAMEALSVLYRRFEDALYSRDGKNEDGVPYSMYVSMDSLYRFYSVFRNTDIADLICYRFYIGLDEYGKLNFMFENADTPVNNPWDTAGVCAGIGCLLEQAYMHSDFRAYSVSNNTYGVRNFY